MPRNKSAPGGTNKKLILDPDHYRLPSLRISHIVYGREKRGHKVVYLVHPRGEGTEKQIAEKVVLYRWRKRISSGFTFSGARLPPVVWRVLPKVLGGELSAWSEMSAQEIRRQVDRSRESMREKYEKVPAAEVLWALIHHCGEKRIADILARHNDPSRVENYGTPDLFLYATENKSGRVAIARFVEVKKPEEPLSKDQKAEIIFLQSLGLHARVLRLIERDH